MLLLFNIGFEVRLFVGGMARRLILNAKLQIFSFHFKVEKIDGLRKVITACSHGSNRQILINSIQNAPQLSNYLFGV